MQTLEIQRKTFPPDDLHADEVGDLHVVLGPDAGDGGGEEHGGPGEGDEEAAGDEELQAVVPRGRCKINIKTCFFLSSFGVLREHPLQLEPENDPWIGRDVILPEVPESKLS